MAQEEQRGPLSQDELMNKLVKARKVMSMVENKNYTEGHVNRENFNMSGDDDDANFNIPDEYKQSEHLSPETRNPVLNEDRIRKSKLPEAIKQAMINNPIQQPTINATESLDMKIFENARRLMKEDSGSNKKVIEPKSYPQSRVVPTANTDEIINRLMPMLENTMRKILDEKLTQILSAHDTGTINENLAIRVGSSVFTGKITKVKNT